MKKIQTTQYEWNQKVSKIGEIYCETKDVYQGLEFRQFARMVARYDDGRVETTEWEPTGMSGFRTIGTKELDGTDETSPFYDGAK